MQTIDIRSFAMLLRKRVDSKEVINFLEMYGVRLDIDSTEGSGEINCRHYGFDVLLTNNEVLAIPGESTADSSWCIHSLRFFSPVYCVGKQITPYAGGLVNDVTFPLDRKQVLAKLGAPSRVSTRAYRYDEYDYPDCSVRFVYPTVRDEVVFATLESPQVSRLAYGIDSPLSPQERLNQLTGNHRLDWEERLRAYEVVLGPAQQVIPTSRPWIDILVFQEHADYLTLVTSGVSDQRMAMPVNSTEPCRVELEIYVKSLSDEVITRFVHAAAFPIVEKTYLGHGDTINWMKSLVSGSVLTADLIIYSILESHRNLQVSVQGDPVQLLWCVPISDAELQFKKLQGIDALLNLFDRVGHPLVLDVFRQSYV